MNGERWQSQEDDRVGDRLLERAWRDAERALDELTVRAPDWDALVTRIERLLRTVRESRDHFGSGRAR